MVVSRDIPVIYVPSLRYRWELTQKGPFFHARQRLQGELRWRLTEAIRRALKPYRVNLKCGPLLRMASASPDPSPITMTHTKMDLVKTVPAVVEISNPRNEVRTNQVLTQY